MDGQISSLSRLSLPDYPKQVPVPGDVIFTLTELHKSLITAKDISNCQRSLMDGQISSTKLSYIPTLKETSWALREVAFFMGQESLFPHLFGGQ